MRHVRARAALAALVVTAGLVASGCAINPATGKRQLVLVSEADEIALGVESDRSITANLGLYPDPALQDYVQQLGESLATRSERPQLDWTFRVVDDPVVNAFALPGGFIYITRGILAYMDSEAQLASVVGHEIGHVTARHGVSQMSKAQLAQLGLGLGMAVSEKFGQFMGLATSGLELLFLKYSRDDERQADDLGLRYLYRAGYDPRPMAGMYTVLERISDAQGGSDIPTYLLTHPRPENRRERIEQEIGALPPDFTGRPIRRDEYLARLDDLVFGENPREGYFDGSTFNHPDLAFRMVFPDGWKTRNTREAVAAISPQQNALIVLSLARESTARAALSAFYAQQGIAATGEWRREIHGRPAASGGFLATTQQGTLQGLVAYVEYGDHVYQMLGYTLQPQWEAHAESFRLALSSFDALRDPTALAVEPRRLSIVRLDRAMTLDEFARRYDATVDLPTLAQLNQVEEDTALEAGETYKVVTGGRLP